jgi:hypothetical protein
MTPCRTILALLLVAGTALPAVAAGEHEVYWQTGFTASNSPYRTIAGIGGGPGYRWQATDALSVHAEMRGLLLLGRAASLTAGASHHWQIGPWHPAIGLQLTTFVGDQVRFVPPGQAIPPTGLPWALQARLQPLRFRLGPMSASALAVDLGAGVDHGALAPALALSLLEIGWQL